MNFLIGFFGGLAVVALIGAGFAGGWVARGAFARHTAPKAEQPGEAERRKLIEEQQAFNHIQNYSTERAYGMIQDDALLKKDG